MISPTSTRGDLVLEAGRSSRNYWRDIFAFRELFAILAWRDVSVRYKQTVFGIVWAVLRPLATMVVLTVVFGKIANMPSEADIPYAILVLAGMLPWTFFAMALSESSNSLVSNANLISKVYFPRLIVPAAGIIVALVDFAIGFVVLIALMAWYGVVPDWHIVLLPAFVVLCAAASFGPGLWLAALNVKYRDFRHIVPFVVQFGLYVSPVGFSSSVIPDAWRLLYSLNPMVGVIDGFRWCILGGATTFYWPGFVIGTAVIVFTLLLGMREFRKAEQSFADLI